MKKTAILILTAFILNGCATGRNLTSEHYIPEWENKYFTAPNPSETSGGYWAAKTANKIVHGTGRFILIPFALLGNVALNAYYIPTWPVRRLVRGDKRLIVWNPIFHVGEEVHSDFFSKEWNRDLI